MENIQRHQTHHPIIDCEEEEDYTVEVEVNSSGHESDKCGNYSRYIARAKLAKKAISLNHDGVICLESNKIHAALKIFTAAYHTHEKLKVKMKTAASSPSSHPSLLLVITMM
jgi:diaminopimelate epimerase